MGLDGMFDVAVIGAGASGTLVSVQFGRLASKDARLALIGVGERPARGVAYNTPFRSHLLNVRAGNMSAFPDDPDHFVRWLSSRFEGVDARTFAPRQVYGDYLAEILENALKNGIIEPFRSEAVALDRVEQAWKITLEHGQIIWARSVVLALGNLLPPADPFDAIGMDHLYRRNPWDANVAADLDMDAPVLLIGTGLTMVDVALLLRESGHRGAIHAVSRHGRLYQRHTVFEPRSLLAPGPEFGSPAGALKWVRAEVKKVQQEGGDWRAVVDSLRPHTGAIWQGWSISRRATFLRHCRNIWDIHRHRMAPEIGMQLDGLVSQGVLHIHAGRIIQAKVEGPGASITLRNAHTNEIIQLQAARVINCTGPGRDYSRVENPLVRHIHARGWFHPDPLRLGVLTDGSGRLLEAGGAPMAGLYTLGPLCIPALWESIAMPEIRMQAKEIAMLLAR